MEKTIMQVLACQLCIVEAGFLYIFTRFRNKNYKPTFHKGSSLL